MFSLSSIYPGARFVGPLIQSQRIRIAQFVAVAWLRCVLSMVSIVLIQQVFGGLLADQVGWARWLRSLLGRAPSIALALVILFSACLGSAACRYYSQMILQRLVKAYELDLMERLTRRLLSFSPLHFQKQTPGDLLQALREDITWLRLSLTALSSIVFEGVLIVGLVAIAIWLSPALAFWALGVIPLVALPVSYTAKRIRERSYQVRHSAYSFFDFVLEMITGIRVIKAYRAEERETQATLTTASSYFDAVIEQTHWLALGHALLEAMTSVGLVLVILAGSVQILNGNLVWANLFAFLIAIRGINGPLGNVYNAFLEIQKAGASAKRVGELLDGPPDLVERCDPISLTAPPQQIAFENVGFSYGEAEILRDVNFQICAGESIAIVGPSGAGKSTLLNLLARFCDPTRGRVLFDGRDVRDFKLADIYSQVAVVLQEPFLFATSARENIRIGSAAASQSEIETAARAAFVHDEIMQLPEGYDTALGIGGRALSRGQAQRVNLARALLKDAPILLLDEATSSLDTVAEWQVQQAIHGLMRDRTSFFVTHKLALVESADRILLVSRNGQVVIGSHDELFRNSATYRQMWAANGSEIVTEPLLPERPLPLPWL